jgi:O-Antigen ligase.
MTSWEWLAFLLFAVFMVIWPFQYGFFNGAGLHSDSQFYFEDKTYYGIMLGIPALILIVGKFIRIGSWEKRHFIALVGLVFPIQYLLHYYTAESVYLNRIMVHNTIFIYSFFVIGILVSGSIHTLKRIMHLYFGIGSIVVLFSFTYLFGNNYRLDALAYSDGVRLTSIFTYANGYAAFLLTMLLTAVYQLTSETRRSIQLAYGSMLVPIVASLMLTLSRSAMLVLPIIAIVALLLVNIRRQLLILIYVTLAFLLSLTIQSMLSEKGLVVYNQIQASISSDQPINVVSFFAESSITGWLSLTVVSLMMTLLVYLISKYNARINIERFIANYFRLVLPLLLIVLSIIIFTILKSGFLNPVLPKQISDRIENFTLNTHSVLERFTFYKDSLSIWGENKWFGGGGKTWEALYDKYQTYPYISSQPHSYIFDLLLDTGIIGIVLIGGGLIYILVCFIIQYSKQQLADSEYYLLYFLIPSSVLLHSVIDFEMSFGFFSALVFFCIGVLAGRQTSPIWIKARPALRSRVQYGLIVIWGIMAIVLLIGTTNAFSAHGHYTSSIQMIQEQRPLNEVNEELKKGLDRVNGHPYILYRLAKNYMDAYTQTKDEQYLNPAKKYTNDLMEAEPHSTGAIKARYHLALATQDQVQTSHVLSEAINNYPYEISYYEQSIQEHYQQWISYVASSDKSNQLSEEEAIREIVAIFDERAQELTKLSDKIGYIRRFVWSDEIKGILSQLKI